MPVYAKDTVKMIATERKKEKKELKKHGFGHDHGTKKDWTHLHATSFSLHWQLPILLLLISKSSL
jgi:hypothetical protein